MTPLTAEQLKLMEQRARNVARRLIEAGLDHTITDDMFALIAEVDRLRGEQAADEYPAAEGAAWGPGIMEQQ